MIYKLADFRKCTRQAFNEAEAGEDVVVERYDKKYELRLLVQPNDPRVIKQPLTETKPNKLEELKDKIGAVCTGHESKRWDCGRKGCQFA